MKKSITINGVELTYELERKNVKNLNLRIRADSSIYVSANRRVPQSSIDEFLRRNADRLLKAVDRLERAKHDCPYPAEFTDGERIALLGSVYTVKIRQSIKPTVYIEDDGLIIALKDPADTIAKAALADKWLRLQLQLTVERLCRELYPFFESRGAAYTRVRFRRMSAQWGNCRPKTGVITFNTRLIMMPVDCIEYVVAHELCHLLHPDHSSRFYACLSECMPDWQTRKKRLLDCPVTF